MHGYNTRRPHSSLGYRPPAPEAHHPVISANAIPHSLAVMLTLTLPGTKPRSGPSGRPKRIRNVGRRIGWVMKRGQHPMYARGQEKSLTFGLAREEEHWQTPQGPVSLSPRL